MKKENRPYPNRVIEITKGDLETLLRGEKIVVEDVVVGVEKNVVPISINIGIAEVFEKEKDIIEPCKIMLCGSDIENLLSGNYIDFDVLDKTKRPMIRLQMVKGTIINIKKQI